MHIPTATCKHGALAAMVALTVLSCLPLHDLDKASSGRGGTSGRADGPGDTANGPPEAGPDRPDDPGGAPPAGGAGGMAGAGGGTDAAETGGRVGSGGGIDAAATGGVAAPGGTTGTGGITLGSGGGSSGAGGARGQGGAPGGASGGQGGVPGSGGSAGGVAPDLPDIEGSPVQGKITYSAGASWDIDGAQWPAFEIHTPTASYWLVKAAAAIVSITDASQLQWINFDSVYRFNRGVPNLGGCCQPGDPTKLKLPTMSTEIDPSFTITSSHLRLISRSDDGAYHLVWDFFLTHFTLTINRAGKPFGFTYRGVPEGAFGSADRLVLPVGAPLPADEPYSGDLPGPAEWAYLTHPAGKQSLFLIQHADDTVAETYHIADGDTGMFIFGGGLLTQTPIRFSLGLMDSCDDPAVRARIDFIQKAIH